MGGGDILSAMSTTEILSRLPADSVVRLIDDLSFVDTHTRRIITSSSSNDKGTKSSFTFFLCQYRSGNCKFHFVEYNWNENTNSLQLRKQPITHDHPIPLNFGNVYLNFMGSCNGLVFLGSALPSVESSIICNPFTTEYIKLLRPKQQKEGGYMVYGFGYHPFTNEYKVVSIHYKSGSMYPCPGQISVYTVGSGRWRNKGEIRYQLVGDNRRPGLLANGALYWMEKDNRKIVSFDLADEEFRLVPLPPQPLSPYDVDELGVLDGCLCVTRSNKTRCESPKEIWVLNQNTNVNMIIKPEESWSWNKLEFSIPWNGITPQAEPHVVLKGGKVLLRDRDGIVCYDPKTKCFTKSLGMFFNGYAWFDMVPYTKSFVSLKALGEEDAKSFGTAQALQQK